MLEYVRKFLSAEFEVVSAVSSGQTALETAARLRPDVIILDIMMPNLGGIEVARRLQESDLGVKTIFLTVEEDRDICLAALETGAMGYVLKSRLGTDLIPAIKQVIEAGVLFPQDANESGCRQRLLESQTATQGFLL